MNVRIWDHPMSGVSTDMVKVFGCRQVYENLHQGGLQPGALDSPKADIQGDTGYDRGA
jgi:hypothetical protein